MTEQPARPQARVDSPSLSAVVPMFEEGGHAAELLRALRDQLAALSPRFEIVVVNDGSRDSTREEVLRVAADCGVHYLELSRNFGKEAAITAGLEAARGEVVVLLDGDGQHPVDVIPAMLERWRGGDDMVYGVRAHRLDEGRLKRWGASLFYRLLGRSGGAELVPDAGDFRLMDRKVVEALKRLPERTRFMKGLYAWVGFRGSPIEFQVRPRATGRSAFGYRRLAGLAVTGITSFTTLPLRALGIAGFAISLLALGYGAWVVIEDLVYDIPVPGYPTLVVSIMFFSGVQLISLGVIGEYLGRVFDEVKRRPNFILGDEADHSPLQGRSPAGRGNP